MADTDRSTRHKSPLDAPKSDIRAQQEPLRLYLEPYLQMPQTIVFRNKTSRTQSREDQVIDEYRRFVKRYNTIVTKEFGNDVSDEILDNHCYPASEKGSFESLYKLLRAFLNNTAIRMIEASPKAEKVSYQYLKSYSDTLSTRVIELYKKRSQSNRNIDIPDINEIRRAMNQCCSYLVWARGFDTAPKNGPVYIGNADIEFLIDNDLSTTKCIELAEGHHLAWTLGRMCALRPSSLGPISGDLQDTNGPPYLTFRDCQIQRRPGGRFALELTVRNLDSNAQAYSMYVEQNRTMIFRIQTPQQVDNFCLSPVLRILVIALRRNALERYSSVEELLAGKERLISFKEEYLDTPIMLKSTPGGLGVLPHAAGSAAFDNYLSRQAAQAGLTAQIDFDSIRHKTVYEWSCKYGNDQARRMMGHAPDSKILEKYYLYTVRFIDISAIALHQKPVSDREMLDADSPLWDRLSQVQLQEAYGDRVTEVFEQLKRNQPGYPWNDVSSLNKKLMDTMLKRKAINQLMEQAREAQMAVLTVSTVKAREQAVISHETRFNQNLLERALQEGHLSDESLLMDSAVANNDHRLVLNEHGSVNLAYNTSLVDKLNQVPYEAATAIVMNMLLENVLSGVVVHEDDKWPLCLQDPAASREDKQKLWNCHEFKHHVEDQTHIFEHQVILKSAFTNILDPDDDFEAELTPPWLISIPSPESVIDDSDDSNKDDDYDDDESIPTDSEFDVE